MHRITSLRPTALLLFISGLAGGSAAAQATLRVPSQYPTIGAALSAAAHGDTVLVAPGTYFERDLSFRGRRITVRSEAGPAATVIDGQHVSRVFAFVDGEDSNSILAGFTLRNGGFPTGGETSSGGGILIVNSAPWIRDCVFFECTAESGAPGRNGVYDNPFTIPDETAPPLPGGVGGDGGGIYMYGAAPRIERCVFFRNFAGSGGNGGAGKNGLDATDEFFDAGDPGEAGASGGRGGRGGAVYASYSSPVIASCLFQSNFAGNGGRGGIGGAGGEGGFFLFGYTTAGGNGGRGGNGGMGGSSGSVFLDVATFASLVNCTVYAGEVGGGGSPGTPGPGGRGNPNGSTGAQGSQGASGGTGGVLVSGQAALANSVLWSNVAPQITPSLGTSVSFSTVQGGFPGVGNSGLDPLFEDPGIFFGASFRPTPASPLLDAGEDAALPAWHSRDLDGRWRIVDHPQGPAHGQGGAGLVDRGAHELTSEPRRANARGPQDGGSRQGPSAP